MNINLRKKGKNNFKKDLFKLINSSAFRKTMENVRKHRDIKLITTDKRRKYLVSESNYDATIFFLKIYLQLKWTNHKYAWTNPRI